MHKAAGVLALGLALAALGAAAGGPWLWLAAAAVVGVAALALMARAGSEAETATADDPGAETPPSAAPAVADEAPAGAPAPPAADAAPAGAAEEVVGPAVAVAEASTKLSLIGYEIRAATVSQGERLETVREAVRTVSSGAETVASHAAESSAIAGETQARAREGADVVARVADDLAGAVQAATHSLELIESLGARVAEVGTIADKIDQIAAGTKLLSLNAAIEAARAGEHGRGFSVVAKEVSSLAESTAEAAAMIGTIVGGIQTARGESSTSSETIRENTQRMDESIARAADSFSRIVVDVDRLSTISADVASTSADQASVARDLEATAEAIAVAAGSTVASADVLGTAIERVGRSADALGAATITAVGGEAARPSAVALESIATAMAPVLALAREQAGRFHALYEEATARRGGKLLCEDLAALDEGFHAAIARFGDMLCGVGAVPGRDVLADVPLWLQWWTNEPTGPQFLECDWDPQSPTFYDYPTAEWFRESFERREPWTAGPFFDEGGTNLHLITISAPVVVDGRAIGVAAADMRVDQIDRLCRAELERVGSRAALVSREGRAVSSTDPAWCAAGAMLDPDLVAWCAASSGHWTVGPAGETLARTPTLPWGLLSLPAG
jgi:methyl-accepting chemotaxis protein-like sensor